MKEESLPRNTSPLARVSAVYPGADGQVRKVQVALADRIAASIPRESELVSYGTKNRPIHKLVLLMQVES